MLMLDRRPELQQSTLVTDLPTYQASEHNSGPAGLCRRQIVGLWGKKQCDTAIRAFVRAANTKNALVQVYMHTCERSDASMLMLPLQCRASLRASMCRWARARM